MTDENLLNSISAISSRAIEIANSASAKELYNLSSVGPRLEQRENSALEIATNSRAEVLATTAQAFELRQIAKAIRNVLQLQSSAVSGEYIVIDATSSEKFFGSNGASKSWSNITLETIHNVQLSTIENDQTLVYNSLAGKFQNSSNIFNIPEYATTQALPISGNNGEVVFDAQSSELKYWGGTDWKVAAIILNSSNPQTPAESSSFIDWSPLAVSNTFSINVEDLGPVIGESDLSLDMTDQYTVLGVDKANNGYGAVYVINNATGSVEQTILCPTPVEIGSWARRNAVGTDGTYIVVGNRSAEQVDIFNMSGSLLRTINSPDAGAYFGHSVKIDSGTVVVGGFGVDKAYICSASAGNVIHTLTNPNAYGAPTGDQFGQVVDISGNYVVVSTVEEDAADGSNSGVAYVYNASTGLRIHTFLNPNAHSTSSLDNFGIDCAIDGNYLVVGAFGESDDAVGAGSGKVYIYDISAGTLLHTIDNPNPDNGTEFDYMGWSVAIDQRSVFVSAWYESGSAGADSGKCYVYDAVSGSLLHTIDNPNTYSASGSDDRFGTEVAISGRFFASSAKGEDSASQSNSGAVYIFKGRYAYPMSNTATDPTSSTWRNNFAPAGYQFIPNVGIETSAPITNMESMLANATAFNEDISSWDVSTVTNMSSMFKDASKFGSGEFSVALKHTLDNPNAYSTSANDTFGYAMASSDTYSIVGAWAEDDAGGANSGKAYIYNTATGALVHTLNNPNPYGTSANDNFGSSVAITDTYAIVGAWGEDEAGGTGSGKAYIYNTATGALVHTLNNPNAYNTSADDMFGYRVAITDTYAIVSARGEDDAGGTTSGKAYIYNTVTGALVHTLNNPNAYSTSADDYFGHSVAITDTYAIVGAWAEDDAGGANSGKAYIYNTATGALVHTLNNPNAYSTSANDYFGYSVAISDTYAIVGAYAEYGAQALASYSGIAYIYNTATGALVHTLNNPNFHSTSANDYFGHSVAITDTYAIVGAYRENDAGGTRSGKAYIYNNATGALLHTLDNPNAYSTSANDYFGSKVIITDTYAIVSARGEDDAGGTTSGKAYIFDLTAPASWSISGWNTTSVTDMSSMFQNASAFDQDISSWNVLNISSLPTDFDTSAAASWSTAEKPQWGTDGT